MKSLWNFCQKAVWMLHNRKIVPPQGHVSCPSCVLWGQWLWDLVKRNQSCPFKVFSSELRHFQHLELSLYCWWRGPSSGQMKDFSWSKNNNNNLKKGSKVPFSSKLRGPSSSYTSDCSWVTLGSVGRFHAPYLILKGQQPTTKHSPGPVPELCHSLRTGVLSTQKKNTSNNF